MYYEGCHGVNCRPFQDCFRNVQALLDVCMIIRVPGAMG